jgi:hypothetical protein
VASGHDNGGEWDGTTGTIVDAAVNSTPVIYNATFIGSGTGALAGNDKGNNAIYIDDRFRGLVYNSVFDDFSRDLVGSASDGPGSGLTFAHNTVGRFGGGTPGNNLSYVSDTGAANTFYDGAGTPINGNSAAGTNPQFSQYIRNSSNVLLALDPRPSSLSPLLTANGATLQAGAPVTTTYRGAFGADNWAAGWTTSSAIGVLKGEAPATGSAPFADVDGDGVSDTLEATTALTNLGFSVGVNNVSPTNLFESIYDTDAILDLRTVGQTTVQKVGGNVTLTVPVEKSTGLNSWAPAGNMTLGPFPGDPSKEFYRLKVEGAQ